MTQKPTSLPVLADNIPEELRALRQWVCWRYESRGGKWTKVPYSITDTRADTTAPATWCDFDEAHARWALGRDYDGIGFVFSAWTPATLLSRARKPKQAEFEMETPDLPRAG